MRCARQLRTAGGKVASSVANVGVGLGSRGWPQAARGTDNHLECRHSRPCHAAFPPATGLPAATSATIPAARSAAIAGRPSGRRRARRRRRRARAAPVAARPVAESGHLGAVARDLAHLVRTRLSPSFESQLRQLEFWAIAASRFLRPGKRPFTPTFGTRSMLVGESAQLGRFSRERLRKELVTIDEYLVLVGCENRLRHPASFLAFSRGGRAVFRSLDRNPILRFPLRR